MCLLTHLNGTEKGGDCLCWQSRAIRDKGTLLLTVGLCTLSSPMIVLKQLLFKVGILLSQFMRELGEQRDRNQIILCNPDQSDQSRGDA